MLCTLVSPLCTLVEEGASPSTKVSCTIHVGIFPRAIMSRLKPISLSNFINSDTVISNPASEPQCPPVTGWRGNPGPVRNAYDSSGFFRGRTDSAAKRKRIETQQEIDDAYDLSRDPNPSNPPCAPLSIPPRLRKFWWQPLICPTTLGRSSRNRTLRTT